MSSVATALKAPFTGGQLIMLIHGVILVSLVSLCVAILFGSLMADPVYASALVFAGLSIWIIVSWRLASGSLLNPYMLFVVGAIIFNGGDALLELVGLNPSGILAGKFDDAALVRTILFCSLSLAFVHLGALMAAMKHPAFMQVEDSDYSLNRAHLILGFVLMAISIIPTYLLFRANLADVAAQGYFGLYQRESATGAGAWKSILSQFLLPATYILLAGSRDVRKIRILCLLVIIAFAAINFFLGYRSPAAASLAGFAWVWHTRVRKLPAAATFIAACLLVFLAFPIIRIYRTSRGDARLNLSTVSQSLQKYDNPAVASVAEMGDTMKTVAYTIQLVPSAKSYEFGASYGFALLGVLPNIFGTPVHPSVAREKPSMWLIRAVNPWIANQGGGWGYSFIAESYLNFGWLGPGLVLLALGWVVGSLQFWVLQTNSAAATGLTATVLFFLLLAVRAESANVIRGIVWYALLPYLLVKLFVSRRIEEAE